MPYLVLDVLTPLGYQAQSARMDKVRVYYDAFGKTLTVWLADPESEVSCEEADDDTVFMKDQAGHIIGFEKLNVALPADSAGLTIEVINAADRA